MTPVGAAERVAGSPHRSLAWLPVPDEIAGSSIRHHHAPSRRVASRRPVTDPAAACAPPSPTATASSGELGRGGMAVVYRAHDLRHDRPVALKVLRPELAVASAPTGSCARSASPRGSSTRTSCRSSTRARCPTSSARPPVLWYAMPLVEGESLRERLRRHGQQPLADALRWTAELADALAYAHAHGIVHRDIKPENVLLSPAAGAMRCSPISASPARSRPAGPTASPRPASRSARRPT